MLIYIKGFIIVVGFAAILYFCIKWSDEFMDYIMDRG